MSKELPKIYLSDPNDTTLLVEIEGGGFLKMQLMMIAANVIEFTLTHNPERYADVNNKDFKEADRYWVGPMRHLKQHINWAAHGYLNALIQEAAFMYGMIKQFLGMPDGYAKLSILDHESIPIFQRALLQFQTWKTREIKQDQSYHSPNWGTATGFNKFDWSDLNENMGMFLQEQEKKAKEARIKRQQNG
jgi:hypothetical protein